MSSIKILEGLLTSVFAPKHVGSLLKHFGAMVTEFQKSNWEQALSKSSKFIEALLKAIWCHAGGTLPPQREFKVSKIINDLKQLPRGSLNDAMRITIPRACEFVYDISSNRGARHDPDEIDPNEMDATSVVSTCSWLLGEILRYAQKGIPDIRIVNDQVRRITQRRYPQIEDVDGRVYFLFKNLSAKDVALLYLWYKHPTRLSKTELSDAVRRHRFSKSNVNMAISRLGRMIDVDGDGKMRLLQPGLKQAEEIIAKNMKKDH